VIRVASVPENHVYVRHIGDPEGRDRVVRLPDPLPAGCSDPGRWWPPVMLDPLWVTNNSEQFDVFHIHFGFDAVDPADLRRVVAQLKAMRKPLVYTVHDLRNPHHHDQTLHNDHLDVLIPSADELITLTPGAAHEIYARWGRVARVVAHPHVVPRRLLGCSRQPRHRFVIGLHVKSLRANMSPKPLVEQLLQSVVALDGAILRVDAHEDVFARGSTHHDPALCRLLRQGLKDGRLELHVHPCFTDDELWSYFMGLDISVLPYRFGTHSGWLEACYDLGTTVLAPSCGYYADQRPCLVYRLDGDRPDSASFDAALRWAFHRRPSWQPTSTERLRERRAIAATYREAYESSLLSCESRVDTIPVEAL
jgi:hypothetical protein